LIQLTRRKRRQNRPRSRGVLEKYKDIVKETARKVIGHKRGSIKEKWISKAPVMLSTNDDYSKQEGTSHKYWESVKQGIGCI